MVLSGPLDGRRKLLGRLGEEARDPIEELLNAALAFEDEATPSLQRFLDWFDRGDVDIKRDPSAPLDAVRVMTVHGAKGLQAPLVILADATLDPDDTPARGVHWAREEAPPVPIFRPRKAERFPPFAEAIAAAEAREREEHWRLLYVALTRAEEHLVIGGALNARRKGVAPVESWHAAIERAMAALGSEWSEDALWGAARHHQGGGETRRERERPRRIPLPPPSEPAWLRLPAPREAQPPRPLAPSSLGRDAVADPPPTPALMAAAQRGRLLHALFERLPAVASERRMAAAERWLTGSAGLASDAARAIATDACAIIADPRFADLFGAEALAEVPIAAVVEGVVVAGTVDRLLVTDDRVRVIDYKTGRRAPASLDAVPEHHLRQIAAYAAALGIIFPGRAIEAGLLYTAGPVLIEVPAAVLAEWRPKQV
jgi:ATP-dependent helicase/nuclease subunit A